MVVMGLKGLGAFCSSARPLPATGTTSASNVASALPYTTRWTVLPSVDHGTLGTVTDTSDVSTQFSPARSENFPVLPTPACESMTMPYAEDPFTLLRIQLTWSVTLMR